MFPAFTLSFRARNSRVVRLTQRYRVPRGVRLESRRSSTSPAAAPAVRRGLATVELERLGAGRYRSTTLVRIPSAWKGRFRYASCFRYTGGSGMGNPRSSCPQRFRF